MDVQRFLYLIAYDVGQPARLRRVQQIRLSLDPAFCLSCARLLIQHKLGSQIDWLAQLQIEAHPSARHPLGHTLAQLRALHARVPHAHSLASLRGLEGAAAASYFEGLKAVVPASLGFSSRNRRPPKDPFNALLSLTYTLVQAETAIALWGAGLDPYVGYYHALDFAPRIAGLRSALTRARARRSVLPRTGAPANPEPRSLQPRPYRVFARQGRAGTLLRRLRTEQPSVAQRHCRPSIRPARAHRLRGRQPRPA